MSDALIPVFQGSERGGLDFDSISYGDGDGSGAGPFPELFVLVSGSILRRPPMIDERGFILDTCW